MAGEIKKRKSSKTAKKSEGGSDEGGVDNNKSSKSKKVSKDDKQKTSEGSTEGGDPPPKFGPMPKLSPHRLWSRSALILGLMTVVWYNSGKKNETPLAQFNEDIRFRGMKVKCSAAFDKSVAQIKGCVPNHCGRIITDEIVSPQETLGIVDLVERVFNVAKNQDVAATIFDLTSTTLKYGGKSVDLVAHHKTKKIFQDGDALLFQSVKSKLQRMISSYFGVDYWSLFLAGPTYITKLTSKGAKSRGDEYWHAAYHKELYQDFDYSTTLFLSNVIDGGRMIFVDGDHTNRTVDSKKGRAIGFTAGEENRHFNERVGSGVRYALTVGFTCDSSKARQDPVF